MSELGPEPTNSGEEPTTEVLVANQMDDLYGYLHKSLDLSGLAESIRNDKFGDRALEERLIRMDMTCVNHVQEVLETIDATEFAQFQWDSRLIQPFKRLTAITMDDAFRLKPQDELDYLQSDFDPSDEDIRRYEEESTIDYYPEEDDSDITFQKFGWDRVQEYLVRMHKRLESVGAEWVSEARNAANPSPALFTWRGHPHELYELVDELLGKQWLAVPKHHGKLSRNELARRFHRVFDYSSGETLELSTAEIYLRRTGPRPTQGVSFSLPQNPQCSPDKTK